MKTLLSKVTSIYPDIKFVAGKTFSWSPGNKTISYKLSENETLDSWSLLHEVAHAQLNHRSYETDFELLLFEVAAWTEAQALASTYGIQIDEEHIQDCLDTYRDWLYQRSTCPTCGNTSLQENAVTYRCFNCSSKWTVTASRFCRPYRLTTKQKTPPILADTTTFL